MATSTYNSEKVIKLLDVDNSAFPTQNLAERKEKRSTLIVHLTSERITLKKRTKRVQAWTPVSIAFFGKLATFCCEKPLLRSVFR